MKRTLVILAVLLAIVFTPFVPQFIAYVSASIRKTGVVVDDETGQPMPNVIVIAAAWSSAVNMISGSAGSTKLYRVVTRTDSSGRYEIPSSWGGFLNALAMPFQDPQYIWVITVFHVGYAVVGDRPDQEALFLGRNAYDNPSLVVPPDYSFRGTHYEVDPIRMYKPTLGLKEAAVYYQQIKITGWNKYKETEQLEFAIRRQGYDLLAPWVCGIDPELELDFQTWGSILGFSLNEENSTILRRKYIVEDEDLLATGKGPPSSAAMVCKIITNERGVP